MRVLAAAMVVLAGAASSGAASSAPQQVPDLSFDDRGSRLVITARDYRLTLDKRDGRIVELLDRSTGAPVARGTRSCLWLAESRGRPALGRACAFRPRGTRSFAYRWSPAAGALRLDYRDPAAGSATVTLSARADFFDLRLTIRNQGALLSGVSLPGDLLGDVRSVEAGYAPNVLPGVRLGPGFFTRVGNDLHTYPSRWAFADYLALDARGQLALYSVNPGPIQPVTLGFLRQPPPGRCSGASFCIVHQFRTWISGGTSWTSPVVRVRIGQGAEESILAYRQDNGIDAYPSALTKLGSRLATLSRAPLIKADLVKLEKPFSRWPPALPELPSPALLHPVAFQPGGHDENDPDFLPPDRRWGTKADLAAAVRSANSRDQLVMPYLNVSWWSAASPTMRALPPPLETRDIAVLDGNGEPVVDSYGPKSGIVVSPYARYVRARVARLFEEWKSEVSADCLFFDQLGARPWIRDFNPASPRPEAYYDGWLDLLAPYAGRCLMVEDGWDRLARDVSGFHGSLLMMAREHDLPNRLFGEGNWEPFPLATWLLHDKVLFYQHDLYDRTMTVDREVLTWNLAFGLVTSYRWGDLTDSNARAWLDLVAALQPVLGPLYAGVPLTGYREVAHDVTETTFGDDLVVLADWDTNSPYATDGYEIAPGGFLARARDDRILAGVFEQRFDGTALSQGAHYVIVERDDASVTLRQPLGADTDLGVVPPGTWSPGRTLRASAVARDGSTVGTVTGELRDGRFVFRYADEIAGRPVAAYRITVEP